VAVDWAVAHALPRPQRIPTRGLTEWAVASWGSMLLLAAVAGVVVFRRSTRLSIVLGWPWMVGAFIALGYFLGLTGQMDGNTTLCRQPNGSCDQAWGFGAVILGFVAALVYGGTFAISALVWRFIAGRRRR